MRKISIKNNLHIKIVAVLLAVILWFYVGYEENPIEDSKVEVGIVYENLSADYVLLNEPESAVVTVRGRKDEISEFEKKHLSLTVDLANAQVGVGEYEYDIVNKSRLDIVSISPKTVQVEIDELQVISVKVEPQITGTVAENYVLGEVSVATPNVSVSGPASYLDTLQVAKAPLNINGLEKTTTEVVPITLLNKNGEAVNHAAITMLASSVELTVEVVEKDPVKIVPVRAEVVGQVADGYQLGNVTSYPYSVTISGKQERLDQVSTISTRGVSVEGLSESITRDASLILPEGITLLDSSSRVRVTVEIKEQDIEQEYIVPIEIRGDQNGLTILQQQNATVVLRGTLQELEDAKSTLRVFVDVSTLPAGMHTLKLQAEGYGEAQLQSMAPQEIDVVINESGAVD